MIDVSCGYLTVRRLKIGGFKMIDVVRASILIKKSQNISEIQFFKPFLINVIFEKDCGKCRNLNL